jgi:hypothetical protein
MLIDTHEYIIHYQISGFHGGENSSRGPQGELYSEDEDSKVLLDIVILRHYTTSQPRRPQLEYSLPLEKDNCGNFSSF